MTENNLVRHPHTTNPQRVLTAKIKKIFASTGGFVLTSPCPAPLRSADRRSESLQERKNANRIN
jgi:hypothetical protein